MLNSYSLISNCCTVLGESWIHYSNNDSGSVKSNPCPPDPDWEQEVYIMRTMEFKIEQLFKSLMALLMAIIFTMVTPGIAQAQPNTIRYTEGGPPVTISDRLDFSDGELRFSLGNGTPNDQLSLTSAADPTAKGAISVDSSGSVFLGNGSDTDAIGFIAENENGTDGKALTIRFSSPLSNPGNVRLVSATSISDAVIQTITNQITYSNSSNNPNTDTRHLNISRKTANNVKDSATVDILLTAVNDTPMIVTNVDATVNEGESITIESSNLTATDPDDSSAELTYTLTADLSHGTLAVSGVNTTDFTQADVDEGRVTYVHDGSETTADRLSFALADGGEDDVTPVVGTLNLTVIPQNDLPVVVNPIDPQMIYSRRPLSFTIAANTFEDADGDALALSVRSANGAPLPPWFSFDPATETLSGTPSHEDVGTLDLVAIADDSNGGRVSTGFVFEIERGNDAPIVVDPLVDGSTVVTQLLSFTVPATTFSDPDGDPLSLSASLANGNPLPTWLSFDQATGTFSGTAAESDIGTLCLVVTADDGQGAQVSDRLSLQVESLLSLKETYTNPNNGHLYFLTEAATWIDAQAEAEEVDGNLVTINAQAEQDWLWGIFGTDEPFWIGLNDGDDEGSFTWISGEDFDYDHWHPIKPDSGYHGGEDEDYVVMNWRDFRDPSNGWADVENDGAYSGNLIRGIVEVDPESLDYSLNGDSGSTACDSV